MGKRQAVLTLTLVLLMVLLSSCRFSGTPESGLSGSPAVEGLQAGSETPKPGQKTVSFTYTTYIGDQNGDLVGAPALVYQKKNPNVKINYQTLDHDKFQEKLSIMVNSKSAPDLFWWNASNLTHMLALSDAVIDLTPYFDDSFRSQFIPGTLDLLSTPDGRISGFPAEASIQGFWYNKSLFAKYNLPYPKTYDEFKHVITVFKQNGVVPIAQGTKDSWPIWVWLYWEQKWGFIEQQKDLFKYRNLSMKDSGIASVFKVLGELYEIGAFPENAASMNYEQMTALFANGKAAMIQLSSDQLGLFAGKPIEKDMVFSWGPDFPESKYDQKIAVKTITNGYGVGSGAARSKDKLEAILAFNKWRYSEEGVEAALNTGLILPVKTKIDFTKYGHLINEQAKAMNDDYKPVNMDFAYLMPHFTKDSTQYAKFNGEKVRIMNGLTDGSIRLSQLDELIAGMDKMLDNLAPTYE